MSSCFKYEGWLYHWTSIRHRAGWKVLGEQRNSRFLCSFILVSQKTGKLVMTLQQHSCNERTHNYLIEVCREEIGDPCGEGWEDGPDTRAPCRTGTVLTGAQLPAHHPLTTPSRPPTLLTTLYSLSLSRLVLLRVHGLIILRINNPTHPPTQPFLLHFLPCLLFTIHFHPLAYLQKRQK